MSRPLTSSASPPRVAYLTNQYPSVSHTFIRREVRALEARGYEILRYAIRPGEAIADPQDVEEMKLTRHVLAQGYIALLSSAALLLLRRPAAALRALSQMWKAASVSDRGLLRHLAYWVEAAWLSQTLEREKVVHVHVHFGTNAASVAQLVKTMCGIGYSMTVHGPDEFDQALGHSLGSKINDSRFTVAISSFGASQLKRWVPYSAWDKIHVVHCTVGPTWFRDEPLAPDAKTAIYVGRLSAQKGIPVLIEAFAIVAKADPGRKLILVGDGDLRAEVEAEVTRHDLQHQVVIMGWQTEEQVRAHLTASRALVMASFAEGLPVVIMEALAMRRPVVATCIMGIPELVREGQSGWLVTAGDAASMAEGMTRMYEAPVEQLNVMGATGQQMVRAMHFADTEAEKLDALFRKYAERTHA